MSGLVKFVNCFEILQDERFSLSEIIIAFYISPLPVPSSSSFLIPAQGPAGSSAFPAHGDAELTPRLQLPIHQLFDASLVTSELKVKYMDFPELLPKCLALATLRLCFWICVWLHVILCASRDCMVLFLPLLRHLLILGSVPAPVLFCDPALRSQSHALFTLMWLPCKPVRAGISLLSAVGWWRRTLTRVQRALCLKIQRQQYGAWTGELPCCPPRCHLPLLYLPS